MLVSMLSLTMSVSAHVPGAGAAPMGRSGVEGVVTPDCRWATAVLDFSSQYDPVYWAAAQVLGPPDTYPAYGDLSTAWASATSGGQREFLVLAYHDPAPINFVNVYETYAPGALDRVSVKNPNTGLFETVWTDTAAIAPLVSRIFTVTFPETPFPVGVVRLDFDSPAVPNWNEVDAVSIGLCDYAAGSQWASAVVGFSSQWSPSSWSAQQVLGAPDTYPAYGDIATAWASLTADGQREFLVLAYDTPTAINFVSLYETWGPGALDKVSVKNPGSGLFETVWTDTAAPAPEVSRIFTASFPLTQFPVGEVRLDFDSPAVPYWNEIDAVGIGNCVCDNALVGVPGAHAGPADNLLAAPRPNPFHGATDIDFSLRREGHVKIEVFNALGQRVTRLLDRTMPAGPHAVQWTGRDSGGRRVASGIYYLRVEAEGFRHTRKVVKVE